jgi:hypothetical protein
LKQQIKNRIHDSIFDSCLCISCFFIDGVRAADQ